jgi:predicted Zn-dependent protease
MKRVALPFAAIALGAVALTAMRKTPLSAASPLPARHVGIASGALARAVEAVVSPNRAAREDLRASTRRRVKANQKGTYISDILAERDSSLARWPDRAGSPLTVWIQPQSKVVDFSTDYVGRVRSAFEDWDQLNLPVHFSFVDDSAHAEVHITWIDRFTQPISGRTRWSRDDDWQITDANIVLAVHHNKGEQLDSESMHAMALHEIGHLLGLDHTTDSLSIMAPRVRVRSLSDADRATVRLVYALPAGPLR